MASDQANDGAVSIAFGTDTDVVFSPDSKTVYVTRNNTITAYDVGSGTTIKSYTIGTSLGGTDISPDGKYIVTVERQPGPTTGTVFNENTAYYVYRLDTTTGHVDTYTSLGSPYGFAPAVTGSAFTDVAYQADGTALLTRSYPGSGFTPIAALNFTDGTFTSVGSEYQDGTLVRSADYSQVVLTNSGISDDPISLYENGKYISGTDNFSNGGGNNGAQAVSAAAGLIVQGGSLRVYDDSFHLETDLGARYGFSAAGVAFSPAGDKLYILEAASAQVYVLSTSTWDVLGSYQTGAPVSSSSNYGDNLTVSPDGRYLSVFASDHIALIDLSAAHAGGATSGNDTLVGTGGNDVIYGFEGNDHIDGGAGADILYGGPGDDTYVVDNPGDQVIEGANQGYDTVYSSVSITVPVNVELVILTDSAVSATVQDGSTASRMLIGDSADNILTGGAGDDTLSGGDGNDTLYGGLNNDHLNGGNGNDTLVGGSGADVLTGGAGDDILMADSGGDTINGGSGHDVFVVADNDIFPTIISYLPGGTIVLALAGGNDTLTSVEALSYQGKTIELQSTNPLIDNLFYDQHNRDVFAAGVDPATHYDQDGWHEGRDPNAFFSTIGYEAVNGDVRAAGIDPLTSYDQTGWKEGADPSANFDTTLYLLHNPDVAAAGIDPLAHYLQYGRYEGRQTYAAIGTHIMADGFDAEYYLLSNPDVAAAAVASGGDVDQFAFQHYEAYGWKEGRNPNAWFDDAGYLATYSDVKAAGINPLDHYDQFGWKEGRDPSAAFDTDQYLAHNADVAAADVDPLVQYLEHGAYELRATYADSAFGHA